MNMQLRIIALVVTATALLVLGPGPQAQATEPRPVPAPYYGMHYGPISEGTWPDAKIGSVRLWDTFTSWRDIQPERGVYDWTRLDAAVDNARRHGAKVTYVFGLTPRWASTAPDLPSIYGPGLGSVPYTADWVTFVDAVVSRYGRAIDSYEVWNEPEGCGFWCGTPQQLARLTRTAAWTIRNANPYARVVSPSFVPRWDRAFVTAYLRAGGLRPVDVVSLHAYPCEGQGPADAMRLVDGFRWWLAARGVRKPIWITEINYETNFATSGSLTPEQQAMLLAVTYRLAWRHGVTRVFWFDWSAEPFLGVKAAASTGSTEPSAAGQVFTQVQAVQ